MKHLFIANRMALISAVKEYFAANKEKVCSLYGGIDFFCTYGTIIQLSEAKDYPNWNVPWQELPLPLIPEHYKTSVSQNKTVIAAKLNTLLSQKQYTGIIVATDPTPEGNNIYDLICSHFNLYTFPTKRFMVTDLTPAGIEYSFDHIFDYHDNFVQEGLSLSYRLRSRFEWLMGMNVTVALKRKTGYLIPASYVKAYILSLVYENNKNAKEAKPVKYYTLDISYQGGVIGSLMDYTGKIKKFETQEEAAALSIGLKNIAHVSSFNITDNVIQPEKLYNFSTILSDAWGKLRFDPEKTGKILSSLYEKKTITFPFVESQQISSHQANTFEQLIRWAEHIPECSSEIERVGYDSIISGIKNLLENKEVINDEKILESGNEAIVPTGNTGALEKLDDDEMKLYCLIYKRLLAWFFPPLVVRESRLIGDNDSYKFLSLGCSVSSPGHSVISCDAPADKLLPSFRKDALLNVLSLKCTEHTEDFVRLEIGSLINFLCDPCAESEENLQLGSAQSCRAIIQLLKSKYMVIKDDILFITRKGKEYVDILQPLGLCDPSTINEWEKTMKAVLSDADETTYLLSYVSLTESISELIKMVSALDIPYKKDSDDQPSLPACPRCGNELRINRFGIGCSGYPGCNYIVWQKQFGQVLSQEQLIALVTNKEVYAEIYSQKKEKYYLAMIMLNEDGTTSLKF